MATWMSFLNMLTAPHTEPLSLRRFMTAEERVRFFQGDVEPEATLVEIELDEPCSASPGSGIHNVRVKRTS